MRRLLVVSFALVSACSTNEGPAAVPQDFDTGLPVFDAQNNDTGTRPDTSTPVDTGTPPDDTGAPPPDAFFPDVTAKDTAIGDVTKLEEGGPPDVPPDTSLPDALSFLDTAVADTARD